MSLLHDTVDREVLTANPNLKAVSSMNITKDKIDLDAATELGIPVTNITAMVTNSTADIAFSLVADGGPQHRARRHPVQAGYLSGLAVEPFRRLCGERQDAWSRRARPYRPGGGAPRPRLRHEDHLLRSAAAVAGGRGRSSSAEYRDDGRGAARGRFRLAASAVHAGDQASDERCAVRADEEDGLHHQYVARPGHRRGRAWCGR